jgi:hypothetical protein
VSRRTLILIAAIGFVIAGLAVLTSPSTYTYLLADGSQYEVVECGSALFPQSTQGLRRGCPSTYRGNPKIIVGSGLTTIGGLVILGAAASILIRRSRQHRQKVSAETIFLGGLEAPARQHPDQPLAAEWTVVQRAGGIAALVPQGEERGFGVWNTDTGELLFWTVEWAETEFTASGLLALSDDRLVLLAWPEMTEIASLPAPAGADSLVVSASQKVVVVGQSEGLAGYQVFGLDPLRLINDAIGLSLPPMWSSPAISPNDRRIACSPGGGRFWAPPAGGRGRFGDLLIHDLVSDTVDARELLVDLPEGWLPNDRDDPQWTRGATELRFESDELLRLRLPDGVWVDLGLPLPESIVLPTPGRDIPYPAVCSNCES